MSLRALIFILVGFCAFAHAGEESLYESAAFKALPGYDVLSDCQKLLGSGGAMLDDGVPNPVVEEFKKEMRKAIIGQDYAIDTFSDLLELLQSFLQDPEKPMARVFMLGPTGVGKTEFARALVRFLGGNPDVNMIRFDGGELQFDHEISRIKGTTAGYKGYGEKPGLHPDNVAGAKVKLKLNDGTEVEFTIILFDEIEKMSEAAFKLLLGILDNGKLTLGDNTPSMLRKTMIVATSNEGAKDVEKLIEERKLAIALAESQGKVLTAEEKDLTGRTDLQFRNLIFDTYMRAVKERFAPEFVNRWQKFVQFLHLEKPQFLKIAENLAAKLQRRVFERAKTKFAFQLTPKALEFLVDRGTDFKNGARELINVFELQLTRRLARLLATEQIKPGDVLLIDATDGKLSFRKIASTLDEAQLKAYADKVYPGRKMTKVEFAVGGDDSIQSKEALVSSLLAAVSKVPLALSSLWHDTTHSRIKSDSVSTIDNGSDSITYKYISVDGVSVRLSYSERELAAAKAKDPDGEVPLHAVVMKIPEADQLVYAGNQLHTISTQRLERILTLAESQTRDR